MHRRRTLALCTALAVAEVVAQTPPSSTPRSVVFDHSAADAWRSRLAYSTLIIVEGIDDERRRKPKPLEERFAAALNPPPPYVRPERVNAIFGDGPICLSLPSQFVPFGGSYNPHGFCP